MMRVEMHEVQNWDDLKNAGDYYFVERSKSDPRLHDLGEKVAVIVCPKCLKPGICSAHKLVQEKPLTITASFLCNQIYGYDEQKKEKIICNWHGWVTNGFMEGE